MSAELLIGLGRVDITPAVGASLTGYGPRTSTSVDTPLYAEVLVCRRGDDSWALISADLLGFSASLVDEIRQRMRQEAFVLVEEDRQKAQEKIAKAQEMKSRFKKKKPDDNEEFSRDEEEEETSAVELITEALFPEKDQEEKKNDKDGITDKSLDELRAMIVEWEESQTENAKQALE